jgi:two-component system response regulator YesN
MESRSNPKARISRALEFVRDHLKDPDLSPSLIAREVGLDLPVFCRTFKQVTGMTSTDYIALERIRVAKRLLTREDLLVKEVAYRVGFENPNYFSRRFKEMEGRTPSSYRRLNHTRS